MRNGDLAAILVIHNDLTPSPNREAIRRALDIGEYGVATQRCREFSRQHALVNATGVEAKPEQISRNRRLWTRQCRL